MAKSHEIKRSLEVKVEKYVDSDSKFRNACNNRCCNLCCWYPGTGCFCVMAFVLLMLFVMYVTVAIWMPAMGPLVSGGFQRGIKPLVDQAIVSNNWEPVRQAYRSTFLLGHSVVIIGTNATGPLGGFVDQRGVEESTKIEVDRKMEIASGSKWVSATVIYAVIEHPLTNLTNESIPSEYLDFWSCSDSQDVRCTNVTIEKLLAFRSGFETAGCEYRQQGLTWEECVNKVFTNPYDPSLFDTFDYNRVGQMVAGLVALKAMQRVPTYETATWDDLMQEFILDKANIVDAPVFDPSKFDNGRMTYDFLLLGGGDPDLEYDPEFPGLSGALACSPRQYAQFAHAFLAGTLVSMDSVHEMTRSHGDIAGLLGFELPIDIPGYQGYSQGMWYAGNGVTHSVGYFGFFPWLDQGDPDVSKHHFGLVAINALNQMEWTMKLVLLCCAPIMLLCLIALGFCWYSSRKYILDGKENGLNSPEL